MSRESQIAERPIVRKTLRAYSFACLVVLVFALASRAIHYGTVSLPPWSRGLSETLMRGYVKGFRLLLPTLPFQAAAVAVLAVACLARPRLLWTDDERPRSLRPWVYAAAGTLAVLNHPLFDADPLVAALCAQTLALLAFGTLRLRKRPVPSWRRSLAAVAVLAALAGAFWSSPTAVVTVAVGAWAGWVLLLAVASGRWLRPGDGLLLALVAVPLVTFLVPTSLVFLVPALRRPPGVVLPERGYAYGFCEVPGQHKLFMTVPMGETGDMERLKLGYVAEYDTRDFARREHRLFDEGFYGGLRMALCLGEVVQVTMNGAIIGGVPTMANVLEFRASGPTDARLSIFDDDVRRAHGLDLPGHDAVYDPAKDAVFYVSEWTNTVFRLDRRDGTMNRQVGDVLPRKEFRPFVEYGLQTTPRALHAGRRTIYLAEWLGGSRIYEMHLDTLRIVRVFDGHDMGSFDLAIDEASDRLFASDLWGIKVFDLGSGELTKRIRTGPGARTAVLDWRRDLIYVPTTLGGHVWVLDRASLETLGRVTTGLGGRPGYLSEDGRHFFASDQRRTYRWDAGALARRFGRGTSRRSRVSP